METDGGIRHYDLFAGIGGFSLAADAVWGNVEHVFCEIDPFCVQVLKKHWPEATYHQDVRELAADAAGERLRGNRAREQSQPATSGARHRMDKEAVADAKRDRLQEPRTEQQASRNRQLPKAAIVTGGFPCQPFSAAGRRRGTEDDRYLWPPMLEVIRNVAPEWVVAENVRGLANWNDGLVLEQVCADLEGEGYEVWPLIIPALAKNAPHRRDRIWFIAHRRQLGQGDAGEGFGGRRKPGAQEKFGTTSGNGPANEGIAAADAKHARLDGSQDAESNQEGTDRYSAGKNQPQQPARPSGLRTVAQESWKQDWTEVAARLCRVDDGLSRRMVRLPDGTEISGAKWRKESLKAYGNAIVPAVAETIMRAMK